MKIYPIIFGPHGGLVAGNGFIARVAIRGKCLFEETGDDFYSVLGVNPGAVASDGASMGEAHRAFLERIRQIVFEIAEECETFEVFKCQVEAFVQETNLPNKRLWDRAVKMVRSGEVDLKDVSREDADSDSWARVQLVVTESDVAEGERLPPLEPAMNEAAEDDDFKVAANF